MTRQEDIIYDFLGSDRIWPPFIASNLNHPFIKALVEVLERLPADAYDEVSGRILFVVEDPQILATNVPFERLYPPFKRVLRVRFDTIVIFHAALDFSHKALVGLIAHELAHSFVTQSDYKADEKETDLQTVRWGFAEELEALQVARDLQEPNM
jgi:hypothetical protein